jgi:uncharacterized Rossmann fold enzyme
LRLATIIKNVEQLKDLHKDQDIWVLGSGSSLNYIDKSFFDNKITVAINEVIDCYLPTSTYMVTKYHQVANQIASKYKNTKVIVSHKQYGNVNNKSGMNETKFDNLYIFYHNHNQANSTPIKKLIPMADDHLIASWSSITSGIHLAAHMGAKNIILAGHDGGAIDNKNWVDGYSHNDKPENQQEATANRNIEFQKATIELKEILKEIYGCNIHSLNPFISLRLEGHTFS